MSLAPALYVGNVEPTVGSYQEKHGENHRCADRDKAAGRPALIVLENASVLVHQEILCWDDERPICVEAREMIAAARAKGLEYGPPGSSPRGARCLRGALACGTYSSLVDRDASVEN